MFRATPVLSLITILLAIMATAQQNRKLPSPQKPFVPWSVLERNGKKLCPLCGEEYEPKDFTKLPPKLSLSEWHPNNLDPDYFETKIAEISDLELMESLDLRKLPKQSTEISGAETATAVLRSLLTKKTDDEDKERYYGYSQSDEGAFITVEAYRTLMDADSAKHGTLMRSAEEILRYEIPYGNRMFRFDQKIDFDYNFGESGKYGFHYWGWGYHLTSAYMLTKDNRFVEAFDEMFNQWYEQRNRIDNTLPQFDVVWYELGIAARLPMFIDAFRLFKNSPALKTETKERMLKTFLSSGRWLAEALKRNPYHPYNWPIHSAISEAYLALTFPEFKESREWFTVAKDVMDEHLTQDVYADGGYLERAPSYSMGVFNHFYRFFSLLQHFSQDQAGAGKYRQWLEKMAEFVMLTMSPLGTSCPFNDSYRSSMVDFLYKFGNDFKRPDFIGSIHPLLSQEKLKQASTKPRLPKVSSINLPDSRFAVMRSGWSNDAAMLILNYGPVANHHHLDVLDLEIYANGKALAVDAGIGLKGYDDELHLNWYRATRSHNMVMINDSSINRGEGEAEDIVWATQEFTDYFGGSHSGYKSAFDAINRRHVAFVKPHYWVVYDKILSSNSRLTIDWLFHSPLTLEEYQGGYISKERPGVLLLPAESPSGMEEPTRRIKLEGMANLAGLPEEEPFRNINYISFQRTTSAREKETDLAVLIYPLQQTIPQVIFSELSTPPGVVAYRVVYDGMEDQLFFSDGKKKSFGNAIESDAEFLYVQFSAGKLTMVSVVEASFCRVDGKTIVQGSKRVNVEKQY